MICVDICTLWHQFIYIIILYGKTHAQIQKIPSDFFYVIKNLKEGNIWTSFEKQLD